jgi:hypothetical protein
MKVKGKTSRLNGDKLLLSSTVIARLASASGERFDADGESCVSTALSLRQHVTRRLGRVQHNRRKELPDMLPQARGRPCFPYRGHASGEGMFNLLTVVLPRRKVIFAEMLQDCHDLEVGSPIFERLRLPTTAMRRRNDRSNTSTTCGICESIFRFQVISSLIDNEGMTGILSRGASGRQALLASHDTHDVNCRLGGLRRCAAGKERWR